MRKLFLIILLSSIFQAGLVQAQEKFLVSGKVLDSATQLPLKGASVFCQNTTFGVITNNEGEFSLSLPKGGYDLVVSYTGFQSGEMRINASNTEPLLFQLLAKDKSMEGVVVAGSNEVPDGWKKYGSFFKEQFLGTTANARQCELENPEALRFFYSKKRNRLKVLAKEDLRIVNQALGYKIRYQLDSLSFEYGTKISTYSGYPFFETMTGSPEEETQWATNRNKSYKGSKLHFMRSWHAKTIEEEGFVLEQVSNQDAQEFESARLPNYYDTSFYYSDSGVVDIQLPGKYRIKFHREMPDPAFVRFYKLPPHIRVQLTVLDILDDFVIEENGYWWEQADLINTGYWSYERLAEAVPYDYTPQQE
jgi:hypothetical protein